MSSALMRCWAAARFVLCVMVAPAAAANAQEALCDPAAFLLTEECIKHRHLDERVEAYTRAIAEAQTRLGVRYDIRLQVINDPANGGYSAPNVDVFTTVRGSENSKPSYLINVTWHFLKNAKDVLIEHSSLHEVAHIMNEDVGSYRKHGAQQETAAEHRVYRLVGEERYMEFYNAYLSYRGRGFTFGDESFVRSVRSFAPIATAR